VPEGGAQKTGHYQALNAQRLREGNNVVLAGIVGMVWQYGGTLPGLLLVWPGIGHRR